MTGSHRNHPDSWLQTDRPVVALKPSIRPAVTALKAALLRGLHATPDSNRTGFYEVETPGRWYYISIPKSGACVYLVAARTVPPHNQSVDCPAALAV